MCVHVYMHVCMCVHKCVCIENNKVNGSEQVLSSFGNVNMMECLREEFN